jgi:hypothetical protein
MTDPAGGCVREAILLAGTSRLRRLRAHTGHGPAVDRAGCVVATSFCRLRYDSYRTTVTLYRQLSHACAEPTRDGGAYSIHRQGAATGPVVKPYTGTGVLVFARARSV